jgi:hypothetical protein
VEPNNGLSYSASKETKESMNKKELEKYIATRPSAKESDGAWDRFVESNKLAEKETPKQTWNRMDNNEKIRQQKHIEKLEKLGRENSQQKTDPILENRGKQTLAINHTANKYLNNQVNKGNIKREDLMLHPDKNGLLTNKAKTIAMRDSFMAKQFNNAISSSLGVNDMPTEATPEQFGKLAERLEKDRQMRGAPTNVQQFKKNFNNVNSQKPKYPGMKTWEKKKVSTPIEPIKIDIQPTYFPPVIKTDPQLEALGKKVFGDAEKSRQEKWDRGHSGIAGIMGGDPKFYGK